MLVLLARVTKIVVKGN